MKKNCLLLSIFISAMTLSCGLSNEVSELNKKIESLTEQLNQRPDMDTVGNIQKQADRYKSENEELKNEVANLRLENERLNVRIQELIARRDMLIGQIDDFLQ